MNRTHVSWSNSTDLIEGPCVVCGKEVRLVIPDDRPNPSMLFHSTCDSMPAMRENLKTATPARLPESFVIHKPTPSTPPPASSAPAAS